jgi:hypothetical protein
MDQLSTQTDVSRFIGALEIGNLPAFDDGALEASAGTVWAAPTRPGQGGCPPPPTLLPPCHPFSDDALEAAAKARAADPVGTRRLPTMPGRCF